MSKKLTWGLMSLFIGFLTLSCSEEEKEATPVDPLVGNWKLAPAAGSLGVGPNLGDYSWWAIDAAGVTTRACLYDDVYTFNADGSFQNVVGTSTWLEAWQGAAADGCGTPVAPHNGGTKGTWKTQNSALTITGAGSYLGLPKVHNTGEDGKPANNTITYTYTLSLDNNTLELTINGWLPSVPAATWYFKFTRQQ